MIKQIVDKILMKVNINYLVNFHNSKLNFLFSFYKLVYSSHIKLLFFCIYFIISHFSTSGQEKRYTYKIYDYYESHDTNKIDLKMITSNETTSKCYFNGFIVNCNNEPIDYLFWTLNKDDTSVVRCGRSDSSGRFQFFCDEGCYTLKIRTVSCQNYEMNLELIKSLKYEAQITLFRKTGRTSSLYITNRKPNDKMINKTREKNHNCKCGN